MAKDIRLVSWAIADMNGFTINIISYEKPPKLVPARTVEHEDIKN